MDKNKIILPITPVPYIRINSGKKGDHILFSMKEVCVKGEDGNPCEDYNASLRSRTRVGKKVMEGYCKHTLSEAGRIRKWAIERYNKFRLEVFFLAKKAGFQLPTCGWAIYFYFPVKQRAGITKKKAEALHGQLKLSRPDFDNTTKAVFDSLSTSDHHIAQLSGVGKYWFVHEMLPPDIKKIVPPEIGFIEIRLNQEVYNPFGVNLDNVGMMVSMEDIEESRRKRNVRKAELKEERREKEKTKITRKAKPLKLIPQKKLFKREDKIR